MRSHAKKKRYQRHVHAMLAAGRINIADGRWASISEARLDPKVAQRAERQAERCHV